MSSRRPLRDELHDVFDAISEPAHPALSARIRERIEAGSAPRDRAPRLAMAVALATAAILVTGLVFVSRHQVTPPTSPAGQPSAAVTATPTPEPSPSSTGTAPVVDGPEFRCVAQSGGTALATPVGVTAARAAAQTGYDRFVLEFDGPVPRYQVNSQGSAAFTVDPSGRTVTLAGSSGLLVTLHGAGAQGSFAGSTDLRPAGTGVLREARSLGDFEGVMSWGLGVSRATCFRAFTLTGPSRLIVDVQT
ncbi:MAG TPA: hypothetical protein VOB72_03970 [Candidatus Dormibacteraeota bacterium]|nr:hypothetical protein [Candidatus Dormibacteraeota bacterium]